MKAHAQLLKVHTQPVPYVTGAYSVKRINQHAIRFYFNDATVLTLYETRAHGEAISMVKTHHVLGLPLTYGMKL